MPTLNATITLGIVVNIKDGVDISNFLLRDTEWLGEPKNADGCVVAINPKTFSIEKKGLPIVKAVRGLGGSKWNKGIKCIELVLHASSAYELMLQYQDHTIKFVNIADMVGGKVIVNGAISPTMVGQ